MGLFAQLVYTVEGWRAGVPQDPPYLAVDVHHDDFAVLEYRPSGPGTGVCYLGMEPRHYFEAPDDHEPVDVDAEAEGLAGWAGRTTGAAARPEEVRPLLADPGGAFPDDDLDDTLNGLLDLLGVPAPDLPSLLER